MALLGKVAGIYQITNMINGKAYIGQSWDIYHRFGDYRWGGSCNRHLKAAIAKYGLNAFLFEVIREVPQIVSQRMLDALESHYIEVMHLTDRRYGYNVRQAGSHGRHAEETKQRISAIQKGRKLSNEHKRHIGEKAKGRLYSAETRAKIGAAHVGMMFGEATIERMRETHRGKRLSRESIEKRTLTRQAKGEWFSEEHKRNISNGIKKSLKTNPFHQTDSWRIKQSKAHKGQPWSAARRAAHERSREIING